MTWSCIGCIQHCAELKQPWFLKKFEKLVRYCQSTDLGLRLGVDFTFTSDNNNNNDNHNNPHLNSLKETVPGGKEQGLGIRDTIWGIKHKGQVSRVNG